MPDPHSPSVLYRPTLTPDGNMWCALYGLDAQVGVSGFGSTPAEAMAAFDLAWASLEPPPVLPADYVFEDEHAG